MPPMKRTHQTPYHLLAVSAATTILRDNYYNENQMAKNQFWVNLTEKDYIIKSIRWLEQDGYQADITFKTEDICRAVTIQFQTVTLHQFISYIAVRQALEKPHAKLLTPTYLRRAGVEIECVVPDNHSFENGFYHNDWYFPADMFLIKDDTLVFHSPVIQGVARVIRYTPN